MTGEPLVSVVIPVYNGAGLVRDAIESVLEQTYPNVEVIAVDDGSTDGSLATLENYDSVRAIRQENAGPGAARNRAIRESVGELIAPLDQDDRWLPTKLERQVRAFVEQPDLEYVLCHHRTLVESEGPLPRWITEEQLRRTAGWFPSMVMFRRDVYDRYGPFDETKVTSSDADFMFRLRDGGARGYRVDEILVLRRIHDENQSRNVPTIHSELLGALRASIQRKRRGGAEGHEPGEPGP